MTRDDSQRADSDDERDLPLLGAGTGFVLDGSTGPARLMSVAAGEALVLAAMTRIPQAGATGPSSSATPTTGPTPWYASVPFISTAVAISLAGVVGTGVWMGRSTPPPPPSVAAPVDHHAPEPTTPAPPAAAPAEPASDPGAVVPAEPSPARTTPSVEAPAARRPSVSTADLLKQANALRAERKFSEAEATYQRAAALDPHGNAGTVARISAGTLQLERLGDPSTALRLFRSALADHPAAALAEEAHWGVAGCMRALGDARGERAALSDFLTAHPDSIHASNAKARLAVLPESSDARSKAGGKVP